MFEFDWFYLSWEPNKKAGGISSGDHILQNKFYILMTTSLYTNILFLCGIHFSPSPKSYQLSLHNYIYESENNSTIHYRFNELINLNV